MRDTELLTNLAGIANGLRTKTADAFILAPCFSETHGYTGYVVTLLLQEKSGDRRIDATTHGDQNPHYLTPYA